MRCWIVILLAACEGSPSKLDDNAPAPKPVAQPAKLTPSYKSDIENLCGVMTRSGAADHDYADRTYLIATWLSGHLTTQDARTFLANIQPLTGETKAKALEDEAARVGLSGCALAAEWRKPSH
jgi:hypothetical protein